MLAFSRGARRCKSSDIACYRLNEENLPSFAIATGGWIYDPTKLQKGALMALLIEITRDITRLAPPSSSRERQHHSASADLAKATSVVKSIQHAAYHHQQPQQLRIHTLSPITHSPSLVSHTSKNRVPDHNSHSPPFLAELHSYITPFPQPPPAKLQKKFTPHASSPPSISASPLSFNQTANPPPPTNLL